jgi:predicted PurR-regulated permease PerM
VRPTDAATTWLRPIVILGSLILITAALYWAQRVLVPVALAVLLSFVLAPFVNALQRRGLRRVFSVIVVVLVALGIIGGVGAAISLQIGHLVEELPQHKQNIARKVASIRDATQGTLLEKVQDVGREVTQEWGREEKGQETAQPMEVQIRSSGVSQFLATLGPAAATLASAGLVFVLVIFMLAQKEDLRNRLVRLVGHGRLVSTTRAIDEASRRLSRFLLSQVLINAGFGVALTIGLLILGVPYAFLWGVCSMMLRFVPYVGTWALAILLIAFSFLMYPGWTEPLAVLILFLALEVVTLNFVEPLVFGRNTGISTVGLLVAAAFWSWLWGPIGLILSTPITACLVVLGRYSPALDFFHILLGDQVGLDTHVMYYQRLLAHDQDEASELLEEYHASHPLEAVFDDIVIPALALAKRDLVQGELTPDDVNFIVHATQEIVDDLAVAKPPEPDTAEGPSAAGRTAWVLGCPAEGSIDELALRMFRDLLEPAGIHLEVASSQTLLGERIDMARSERPAVVCVAAVQPGGLSQTRYLCKRLRHQVPDLKILVGLWGGSESKARLVDRLGLPPHQVGTALVESRDQLVPLARETPVAAQAG